ncbi:hypothetical protein AKJ61_04735 [candidate division MSBL1 archaeon SCGC-AAA259B11]|uniref:N-acetyltransferase domain-containing protein n=1 Tax=candidate division MSBL1 archaeon SCGC-AAA259B11 TaxID=1698260 RepID=A0A133U2V8_9EURY|nr:hypothetical protein AKJ61_04735 [candidate division MSBL1 archaeon SCGC-AAA259B11]
MNKQSGSLNGTVVKDFEIDESKVVFRYPNMEDIDDLLEYINSLIEENTFICRKEKVERDDEVDWLKNTLKETEEKRKVHLVVEFDDKVMGSADVKKKSGKQSHVGELGIGLRREIREKGIGVRLMKSLIDEAKSVLNLEILTLEVFEKNKIAKNLYEKVGFKKAGVIQDKFFQNDEYQDSIVMELDLRD